MAEKKPSGAVRRRPHRTEPKRYKRIPWAVCHYCGLVFLNNEPTRKAIRKGCWKYEDEK